MWHLSKDPREDEGGRKLGSVLGERGQEEGRSIKAPRPGGGWWAVTEGVRERVG